MPDAADGGGWIQPLRVRAHPAKQDCSAHEPSPLNGPRFTNPQMDLLAQGCGAAVKPGGWVIFFRDGDGGCGVQNMDSLTGVEGWNAEKADKLSTKCEGSATGVHRECYRGT